LPNQEYRWRLLQVPLELTALQGNIAVDELSQPMLHLHGTFSAADMRAYGGHIKEAEVAGTCEIFIHLLDGKELHRSLNDDVGLKLLDL
jgi:predicted DNA-binding protein with PD1-like motif